MSGDTLSKQLLCGLSLEDDARKQRVVDFGSGMPWLPAQTKLRKTRGLPLLGPSHVPQSKLTQQARQYGYDLTVSVPPALHLSGLKHEVRRLTSRVYTLTAGVQVPKVWHITDAALWDKLMALMPNNQSEMARLLLRLCLLKIGSGALAVQVEGWHGLWELAILTITYDLECVWSEADIKMLLGAVTAAFKTGAEVPPGAYTAGACAAAALWWLLVQPKFWMHGVGPRQTGATPSTPAAGEPSLDSPHATDPTAIPTPTAATGSNSAAAVTPASKAAEPSSPGKLSRRKSVFAVAMGVQGVHVGQVQVVTQPPAPQQILHGLLQTGLLRSCVSTLKAVHQQISGPGGTRMRSSHRCAHVALAVTWTVDTLWQACCVPFLRDVWAAACAADLTRIQGSVNGASTQPKDVGGLDLLGVEPESLWACLITAGSLPSWLHAPPEPHMLCAMAWEESVKVIQRTWKVRMARRRLRALIANMKATLQQTKGSRALRAAAGTSEGLTDADREAARIAMSRLAVLFPTDTPSLLALGLDRYWEFTSLRSPSVAAVEALMHTLQGPAPMLQHFIASAELPLLLRLLQPVLPLRSQHLACCVISTFFTTELPGGLQAWLSPNRGADVHTLLPKLEGLVHLEPQEQILRYGPLAPVQPVGPHPRNYQQPPLLDARWHGQGSEASVHAAVCVWGCARLLAADLAVEARKKMMLALGDTGGKGETAAQSAEVAWWARPLRLQLGQLGHKHKSVRLILTMTSKALQSPRHGPATQVLGVACVALAYEQSAVPLLLLLGLADPGDPVHDPERESLEGRKAKGLSHPLLSKPAAKWGAIEHPQGLVGCLVDANVPVHAESAAAMLALIALAHSEAQSQAAASATRLHSHAKHSHAAGLNEEVPLPSAFGSRSLSASKKQLASSKVLLDIPAPGPIEPTALDLVRGEGNWAARLLRAGGWRLLDRCLQQLAESSQLQQVVAIGLMYLTKEILALYKQMVVEWATAKQGRGQGGSADLSLSCNSRRNRHSLSCHAWPVSRLVAVDWFGPDTRKRATPQEAARRVVAADSTTALQAVAADASTTSGPSKGRMVGLSLQLAVDEDEEEGSSGQAAKPHGPDGGGVAMSPMSALASHGDAERGAGTLGDVWAEDNDPGTRTNRLYGRSLDLNPLFRLLLVDHYGDMEDALRILPHLLLSQDDHVLMYAAMAVRQLALVPELQEPLGAAGAVVALVRGARRWVDMDGTDQRSAERTAEWTMEALVTLLRGPQGNKNVHRFAAAWKPVSREEGVKQNLHGFGYPMQAPPGRKPPPPARTHAELVSSTLWSGLGWGQGQVTDAKLHQKLGKKAGKGSTLSRGQGSAAFQDSQPNALQESRSAVDPIQLMVQVVDVKGRTKAQFLHAKLPALAVLQLTAKVQEYRVRMVEAGVGPQLVRVVRDPAFDAQTKASAGALWSEIKETPEGQDSRWWGCLVSEHELAAAGGRPDVIHRLMMQAQGTMSVDMLQSGDPEQQLVGARDAARLLCKGPVAKGVFMEIGGLTCLLHLASSPGTSLELLAPTCNALLNLSSYIPTQVEMCQRALRILLHLNSSLAGLNAVLLDNRTWATPHDPELNPAATWDPLLAKGATAGAGWQGATNGRGGVANDPGAFAGEEFDPLRDEEAEEAQRLRDHEQWLFQVLYCTSGALWNLSRHPDNHDSMYQLELELKTRSAAADTLESVVSGHMQHVQRVGVPSKGTAWAKAEDRVADTARLAAETLVTLLSAPLYEGAVPLPHGRRVQQGSLTLDSPLISALGAADSARSELSPTYSVIPEREGPGFETGGHVTASVLPLSPLEVDHQQGGSGDLGRTTGGVRPMPTLPTLRHLMLRPLSHIWAPLLVDVHNDRAQPLFQLDAQPGTAEQPAVPVAQPEDQAGTGPAAAAAAGDVQQSSEASITQPVEKTSDMPARKVALPGASRTLLRPTITSTARPGHSTRWSPHVTAAMVTPVSQQSRASVMGAHRSQAQDSNGVKHDVLLAFQPQWQRAQVRSFSAAVSHSAPATSREQQPTDQETAQTRSAARQTRQVAGALTPRSVTTPRSHSSAVGSPRVSKGQALTETALQAADGGLGGTASLSCWGAAGNMLTKVQDLMIEMRLPGQGPPAGITSAARDRSSPFAAPQRDSPASRTLITSMRPPSPTGMLPRSPRSTGRPSLSCSSPTALHPTHSPDMHRMRLDSSGGRNAFIAIENPSPGAEVAWKQKLLTEFQSPDVAVWSHLDGSRTGSALFAHYQLPGELDIHIYRERKTRVDELLPDAPCSDRDMGGKGPSMEGIDELSRSLLKRCTELPFEPKLPHLVVPEPPQPGTVTLPDLGSLNRLPAVLKPKEPPRPDDPVAAAVARKPWRIEDSIFAPRPKENDSKGYYDRDGIERDVFDADWALCQNKERFNRFMDKWAKGEALEAAKQVLRNRYADLLRIFDFYASLGAGDPFSMHIVPWGQLMLETCVADEGSTNCKLADLDRIFLATNFEEDKKSEASKLNLDNALMRHEFLEAIVRVAVTKFLEVRSGKSKKKKRPETEVSEELQSAQAQAMALGILPPVPLDLPPLDTLKKCKTLEDACVRLLDYYLLPRCAPECWISANRWREERLYKEDVDLLYQENRPVVEAIYQHYRALMNSTDARLLDIPEYIELLTESKIFHRYFNVRESRLAFIWSRMRCLDESTNAQVHQRARGLTFIEFLEALGRVADMISPPPPEELATIGCDSDHPTTQYYMNLVNTLGYFPDRASAGHLAPKTRPLDVKIEQLLELLVDNLMDRFEARNQTVLIQRLKQGRGKNYQLGKSGM